MRANALTGVATDDGIVHCTLAWPEHPHDPALTGPRGNQRWFCDIDTLPQRYRLFMGGIGSGKTLSGAEAFIRACQENPGCTSLCVGRDMKMVVTVQEKALLQVCELYEEENGFPLLQRHNKTRHELILNTGHTILCVSAEEPEALRGPNITNIWADEITTWSHEMRAMKILRGRLRGEGKKTRFRHLFVTCTPKGPRGAVMNWVHRCRREIAPGVFVGEGQYLNWLFVKMKTKDNDALPPDYEEELRGEYDADYAAQELDAELKSLHGKVYSDLFELLPWPKGNLAKFEFDPSRHEIHVAIDWGTVYPHVLWIAHDPSERAKRIGLPDVIVDEFCVDDVGVETVIDIIEDQESVWGRAYSYFYPDPKGRFENNLLATRMPHVPQKKYFQTYFTAIRWGVYITRSRLRNSRGDRRLAISVDLLNTPSNRSPEGRGIVNSLINYDYQRGRDGKAKDGFKDDSWYVHGADAIRYYLSHMYPGRNDRNIIL